MEVLEKASKRIHKPQVHDMTETGDVFFRTHKTSKKHESIYSSMDSITILDAIGIAIRIPKYLELINLAEITYLSYLLFIQF